MSKDNNEQDGRGKTCSDWGTMGSLFTAARRSVSSSTTGVASIEPCAVSNAASAHK